MSHFRHTFVIIVTSMLSSGVLVLNINLTNSSHKSIVGAGSWAWELELVPRRARKSNENFTLKLVEERFAIWYNIDGGAIL